VLRAFFRKLKFLRLLHRISPLPKGGYAIDIDGPFSLFESVTKYGLQLALLVPAVSDCDQWVLEAEVQWGAARTPLRFKWQGRREPGNTHPRRSSDLADEAALLLERLGQTESPWRPKISTALLNLPGVGTCIPDLELAHRETGRKVFVEVLGFWSRDAVWKRVALAEAGLGAPMVFVVNKRLRVSAEVLGDEIPAALYVHSGTPNARALLERVEEIAARPVAG
jgi:predicted nuclease of restriction endonuclease-like RecB superfamily